MRSAALSKMTLFGLKPAAHPMSERRVNYCFSWDVLSVHTIHTYIKNIFIQGGVWVVWEGALAYLRCEQPIPVTFGAQCRVGLIALSGSLLLGTLPARARTPDAPTATQATVSTCFTAPGMLGHCAARIAALIDQARSTVRVQAYSFTSVPIIKALLDAHARGVDVQVIVDKSSATGRYTGATPLVNAGVPVFVDERPAIAHNKVIILDGMLTIGGSFNFTASADTRNAENVVFIESAAVARSFTDYWQARRDVSRGMP